MDNADKYVAIKLVITGLIIMGALLHVFTWNEHSLSVLPLKIKGYTGLANSQDYIDLSVICQKRRLKACYENSLENALRISSDDKALIYQLAKYKIEAKKYRQASQLMSKYFKLGGKGAEQRFLLSEALYYSGDFKNAEAQLRYLVYSRKDRVHPDIPRLYVKLLMQKKQWREAKKVIEHYRRSEKNASYFLNKEFKLIQKNLKRRRS